MTTEADPDMTGTIDELAVEEELVHALRGAGAHSALIVDRKVSSGGWGAEFLTVVEYIFLLSAALRNLGIPKAVEAIIKKHVRTKVELSRVDAAEANEPRMLASGVKPTRKRRPTKATSPKKRGKKSGTKKASKSVKARAKR